MKTLKSGVPGDLLVLFLNGDNILWVSADASLVEPTLMDLQTIEVRTTATSFTLSVDGQNVSLPNFAGTAQNIIIRGRDFELKEKGFIEISAGEDHWTLLYTTISSSK